MTTATQTDIPLTGRVGRIIEALGADVLAVEQCQARRGIARINPDRVVAVAQAMFALDGARLATATGLDVRDGIDVLYHWIVEPRPGGEGPTKAGVVVTLKALARRPDLSLDSIANVIPAANWIEREMHDLLGVNFRGHPDMRRLVLDDSWPEGVHPLRKSFDQVLDRPPLPPNQSPPDLTQGQEGQR